MKPLDLFQKDIIELIFISVTQQRRIVVLYTDSLAFNFQHSCKAIHL